jgi:broad specificity phosphatase PhoE
MQGNTDESSLTRTGEEQAMKALRSIAHIPFDR